MDPVPVTDNAGTPLTRRSEAFAPITRSVKVTWIEVKFVIAASPAGVCDCTKGGTVLVGGIVIVMVTAAEVLARPLTSVAIACMECTPNELSHVPA